MIIASPSRRRRVYHQGVSLVYQPQLVAVYHQCEALYIIKPQENTRWRVMIYAFGDDIHADAWWYAKPAAWIKKFRERSSRNFLAAAQGFEPRKWRSQSPLPYRLATPLRCIFSCTLWCGIYYSRKWGKCQAFFESFCAKFVIVEKIAFCPIKFAKRLYFLCK